MPVRLGEQSGQNGCGYISTKYGGSCKLSFSIIFELYGKEFSKRILHPDLNFSRKMVKAKTKMTFKKKNANQGRKIRSTRRLDAIVPGVGLPPPSAFGSNGNSRKTASGGKKGSSSSSLACWDGLSPVHLALPRAIGPYTVIRLTRTFTSTAPWVLIGTFEHMFRETTGAMAPSSFGSEEWSKVCAITCADTQVEESIFPTGINPQARFAAFSYETLGGLERAQVTPSAMTVQIMNTNALQTTNGTVYGGIVKTLLKEASRNVTPEELAQDFITTQAPRLMAMPKLALRGVKIQSYPMNMSKLANFATFFDSQQGNTTDFAWGSQYGSTPAAHELHISPTGFAPIMIYRTGYEPDGSAPLDRLTYQITTEFRCRFDLTNVAASTHRHHKVSTDSHWDRLMTMASNAGHGVLDIADSAAVRGAAYDAAAAGVMSLL